MKNFLFKVIIMVFLIIIGLLCLYFMPGNYEDYYAVHIDKVKLLQTVPSPRIIFVGGSGLAFGLDSEMIEQETGYRTVNMGLHAPLGLRLMLKEMKPYVQKDDIFILVPEYDLLFSPDMDGFGKELTGFLDTNPFSIKYYSLNQMRKVMCNMPVLFRCKADALRYMLKLKIYAEPVYSRKAFNKYGDAVGHMKVKQRAIVKNPALYGQVNYNAILLLNDFASCARKKGAKVYFCFSPYLLDNYNESRKEILLLQEELKKNLNMEIIGQPEDYVFSSEFFFDTSYHLNGEGRKIRTRKIICNFKKIKNQKL